MGARPRARYKQPQHPPRKRPPGGSGESRRVSAPVPGVPYPTDPFLTVQLPVTQQGIPRTGLAGPSRRDPVVADMLAYEAHRIAQQAQYAAPREVGRMRRGAAGVAASFVYALQGMTGGMVDLTEYYRPETVAAGSVDDQADRRAGDSTGGNPVVRANGPVIPWLRTAAYVTLAGLLCIALVLVLFTEWGVQHPELLSLAATGLLALAMADQLRPTPPLVDAPAPLTWRDVPLEPFAAVCPCPACGQLVVHGFAAAQDIPAHDPAAAAADGPVIWRTCSENDCSMVWAQLQ